jgi:hypothetical protein
MITRVRDEIFGDLNNYFEFGVNDLSKLQTKISATILRIEINTPKATKLLGIIGLNGHALEYERPK